MTWIVMAGGEDVPILHPQNTITLGGIAHGLAQINRFAGATVRPYSVAEHSLLCADIAAEQGHSPAAQGRKRTRKRYRMGGVLSPGRGGVSC